MVGAELISGYRRRLPAAEQVCARLYSPITLRGTRAEPLERLTVHNPDLYVTHTDPLHPTILRKTLQYTMESTRIYVVRYYHYPHRPIKLYSNHA